MPKPSLHILTWSQDHTRYELYTQGQLERFFSPEDTDAWQTWLATATSFSFRGAAGRLNVYKEARRDASYYWYAYHTTGNRTSKRYLGQPAVVTFARLEEAASSLVRIPLPPPAQDAPDDLPEMPLLSSRLVYPLLRSELVIRERLLARLDNASSHRLTLLSASAGWGKTTLLSMWAARSHIPMAWLSLDALDNDPTRFWVTVIAALRRSGVCSPLVGERALALLRAPQPSSLNTVLITLLDDLSRQSTSTFLLLDDYHVIEDQAIHDSLIFLLEHLPAHLHLVLASRTDPPLSLARLRVHGFLLELRDADLRFQGEEVGQFLTQTMSLALAPTEIVLLARRTEGWVAGLHLAALALSHHPDHATFVQGFAGSHRYLVDYVQEDILAYVEKPLQDFLLHCSILTRLSAALCQEVTAQLDIQTSQQMLEHLERANLFLVPLDEERRWYRLHDLFREALLARLHATQPEVVRLLHIRAARFYERQGEWSEAISHLLAAADYVSAVRIMEETAEQFWLRGEVQVLFLWIMALPDAVIRTHAGFVLKAAWYLLNAYAHTSKSQLNPVRAQVERLLTRVEEAVRWIEREQAGLHSRQHGLLVQRLSLVRLMSELSEQESRHNLEQLIFLTQQGSQVSLDDDLFWQMIPLGNAFVHHYTLLGDGAVLLPRLLEMKQQVSQSRDRFALLKVKQWLALVSLQAGQLYQTHRECLEAFVLLEHLKGAAYLAGYFGRCLASVYVEWNQLDEARPLVQQVIAVAAARQQIDLLIWGYMLLTELEIVAGNLEAATQVLQEEPFRLSVEQGLYQFWRTSVQVRLWLAQGNMTEANAWAEQTVFRPNDWAYQQIVGLRTLIRVYLAGHQYSKALETLETFREYLDRPENNENTLYFLLFSATALYQTGEREQARSSALRLLNLTQREGYLRIYLDMGEPMQQLLHSLLDTPQDQGSESVPGSYISTLLAAFEQEKRMRTVTLSSHSQTQVAQLSRPARFSGAVSRQAPSLEPLTVQEQRVLRLLAAGRSNQEIAERLVVSRNTVKTHLKNLYSKLQVKSRSQAIALARDLHLLFFPT